jgi:hypothetical protein
VLLELTVNVDDPALRIAEARSRYATEGASVTSTG